MSTEEAAAIGRIAAVDEAWPFGVPDIGLNQLYEQGRYVHIDVTVKNLSDGVTEWPKARFKMSAQDGVASLEFRRGPQWPDFFDSTAIFHTDSHGDVLRFDKAAIERSSAQNLGAENEAKLRALLANLVSIAERSARMANMQSPSRQEWLEGLKALAAAGERRGSKDLESASLIPEAPSAAQAAGAVEVFDQARQVGFYDLRVNQLYEQGRYAHIDVTVTNFSDGAQVWPESRFKIVAQDGVARLEFRKGPQWPDFFDSTVAFQIDSHGDVLRFGKAAIEQLSAQNLGAENEAKLRALLANLMPIAERSAGAANMLSPRREEWLDAVIALVSSIDGS